MSFNDPIMSIINSNLSYRDRREVLDLVSESAQSRSIVYSNIGNYFFKRVLGLKAFTMVKKIVETTKGDITKLENFKNTLNALDLLAKDAKVSKDAATVKEAVNNIKIRKKLFSTGITADSEIVKIIYGSLVKAVVCATSLLINKTNLGGGFDDTKWDYGKKQIKPFSIFSLEVFNKYCKEGGFDSYIQSEIDIRKAKIAKEGAFLDALMSLPFRGLNAISSAVIVGIRNLVYWVYYTRMDIADYLEHQAAYIEVNKYAVQNRSDISEDKKREIIEKQTKWQQKLLDLADRIQIEDVKAVKKAQEQAKSDEKEFKKEDAMGNGSNIDTSTPDFF